MNDKLKRTFCCCLMLAAYLFLIPTEGICQSLFEDAKGESSVILPVGNIFLNTSASKIGAAYYYGVLGPADMITEREFDPLTTNVRQGGLDKYKERFSRVAFGGRVSGKAADGLAPIFSEGMLTPEANYQALVGLKGYFTKVDIHSVKNKLYEDYDLLARLQRHIEKEDKDRNDAFNRLKGGVLAAQKATEAALKNSSSSAITAQLQQQKKQLSVIEEHLNTLDQKRGYVDPIEVRNALEALKIEFTQVKSFNTLNDHEFEKFQKNYEQNVVLIDAASSNLIDYETKKLALAGSLRSYIETIDNHQKKTYIIYLAAEGSSREFQLYTPSGVDFKSKFNEINFNGYHLRVGTNFYINTIPYLGKGNIFGISLGVEKLDNYTSLEDFKFSSREPIYQGENVTINNDDKIEGKAETAELSYARFRQYPLYLDYVKFFQTENNIISINPFFRFNFKSNDSQSPGNIFSNGVGIYFMKKEKSVFVLGLVGEYRDWQNNYHGETDWYKRINASLVARVNLTPLRLGSLFPTD